MYPIDPKDLRAVVANDIRLFIEHRSDLNPYSTERARSSWQNGFDGTPSILDWGDPFDRGALCAEMIKKARD